MSPKLQTAIVSVLALATVGVYGKLALSKGVPTEVVVDEASEPETPLVIPPRDKTKLYPRQLSEGLFDKGQWRGKPALADLNGDGHLDLVASIRVWEEQRSGEGIYVWLGDGQGNWKTSNDGLARDLGYGGARVHDVNGDGHLDLAFSSHNEMPKVYLGDGRGRWEDASAGIVTTGPSSDVAIGDIDGDGLKELVSIGQFSPDGGVHVFRQDGSGGWLYADELEKDVFGQMVQLVDLDDDGTLEVIATCELGPRVWRFDGEGFVEQSAGLPQPEVGGSDLGFVVLDLDGDGYKELFVTGFKYEARMEGFEDHQPLRVFRWDGEAWGDWGEGLPDEEACFDIAVAELDGKADTKEFVVVAKHGLQVLAMAEPGVFECLGRVEGSKGTINITTGDVNADGIDEVLAVGFRGVQVLDLSKMYEEEKP